MSAAEQVTLDERVERALRQAGWADAGAAGPDEPTRTLAVAGDGDDSRAGRRSRLAGLEGPQASRWADLWAADEHRVRYLVDPVGAYGETVRIYSPAKAGKSLLAQEAAAGLATGREVLGVSAEPVRVVYVDQENREDDWRERLAAMGYGPEDDLESLFLFDLQSWPPLDTADGGRALLERVAVADPVLVILDTFGKFVEGPEDKADTSLAVYRHTLAPLRRDGRAVWLLDHAGKDVARGARGSSSKADDVDSVWRLTSRGAGALTLRRTHSRQRHDVDTLYLRREVDPLRHVVETVDERAEELVEVCLAAIRGLEPSLETSRNKVADQLRQQGKSYRNDTVSEAFRRWQAEAEVGG